jgi:hypothetical protein
MKRVGMIGGGSGCLQKLNTVTEIGDDENYTVGYVHGIGGDLHWLEAGDGAEGRETGVMHILFSGHHLHPFHSLRHGIARHYRIFGRHFGSPISLHHPATFWHICLSLLPLHRRAFLYLVIFCHIENFVRFYSPLLSYFLVLSLVKCRVASRRGVSCRRFRIFLIGCVIAGYPFS